MDRAEEDLENGGNGARGVPRRQAIKTVPLSAAGIATLVLPQAASATSHDDSPPAGSVIYAATTSGLSISTNGGATFENVLAGEFVQGVFASGSTVYAATFGGLSISTNGGSSFVTRTTDHGLGDASVNSVYALGSTVYAATGSGLSISTDGVVSFSDTRTTFNASLANNQIDDVFASSGEVYNMVYAASTSALEISDNGGGNFLSHNVADGLGANWVHGVFVSGGTVYAATEGGLSISTGIEFNHVFVNRTTGDGLGANRVRGVFVSGSTVYAATDGGLSISTNGGSSGSFSNRTVSDGLASNFTMAVSASGSTVCVATSGAGLSISTNGGSTFVTRTTDHGLGSNDVFDVHVG
jgi:hypothetical protein